MKKLNEYSDVLCNLMYIKKEIVNLLQTVQDTQIKSKLKVLDDDVQNLMRLTMIEFEKYL